MPRLQWFDAPTLSRLQASAYLAASTSTVQRIHGMQNDTEGSRVTWRDRLLGVDAAVLAARNAVAHLKPAVVVTGGSHGIGFALAQRFLAAGREVAVVARNAPRLDEAVLALQAATGRDALPIICDVVEPNAFAIVAGKLSDAGLYLDVLVNNAGVGLAGPFVSHDALDIERLLTLNIDALTRLTRAALPPMLARRRGGILNMASLGAYVPGPNQAAHYASKAYVVSLTEALASENSGKGVRICVVVPGPVKTGFHCNMGAEGSLYRFIIPALAPKRVARSAYIGFQFGSRTIVPGIFNKIMFLIIRALPHPITVPFVYWLLKRRDD
jgi:short-subunit dehydrogenase